MRGQIIDSIFNQMQANHEIFFVTADMGINLVEKFGEKYPDRYVNVGIAEQNMVGVSAGLANLGYRPFAYTISNFTIHRCFEQIRNDIGMHHYPITLLGTSTGFDNPPLGPTHHIVDEWGTLKSLPEIDIYCPSSVTYASTLISRVIDAGRPAYIRIPKGGHAEPASDQHLVEIKGEGRDNLLISYGGPAQCCLEAQKKDPSLSVLVVNRLRPLADAELEAAIGSYKRLFVVEDHFPNSGLYGSICEFIARKALKPRIYSLAPTNYTFEVGRSPEYFYKKYGLDADGILKTVAKSQE